MAHTSTELDDHIRQALESAAPPRPKNPRPIIVIGAGGIIRDAHLPAYAKAGFPVIAIADAMPGKAAELMCNPAISTEKTRSFESVSEAVSFAPPDAVFDIAVPAGQLLTILPQLPDAAAVLMQKPMGNTLEEARAIRDLCRAKRLTAAVNFQLRFAPNNLAAQALARHGLMGDIHDMEVQIRCYMPWQLWTFLSTAPRLEILYHSIHYLDLVRSWFGNPLGVYAKTVRNPQTPSLAATRSSIILDYGEWKRSFVVTTHGHDLSEQHQQSFVQWEGTGGAMRMVMGVNLDYPTGKPDTLHYIDREPGQGANDLQRTWKPIPITGNWFPDAFIGSMGSLQAYAEGSAADLPTHYESAYQTMALVEAAYRSSARDAEPVPIDD